MLCFFFSSRRRHTRCLSDWSSDVCSSDLYSATASATTPASSPTAPGNLAASAAGPGENNLRWTASTDAGENGRASWRGRGEISVGAASLKKKKKGKKGAVRRLINDKVIDK